MSVKRGLGRGLDSLFAENEINETSVEKSFININEVEPNRNQPRKHFDEVAMFELAESIKQHGLIQPIIVKPIEQSGRYTIIAGERRWRASRIAGLKEIPVVIKDVDKKTVMQLAMIENLQRENLNPIEESLGYKSLIHDYNLTQEEVAKSIGKSRSVVANSLRLLNLPEKALIAISDGKLSKGHGKVLLSLNDEKFINEVLDETLNKSLSVRQLEILVEKYNKNEKISSSKQKSLKEKDTYYQEVELSLSEYLSTPVKISKNGKFYTLEIKFHEKQDLEDIIKGLCN